MIVATDHPVRSMKRKLIKDPPDMHLLLLQCIKGPIKCVKRHMRLKSDLCRCASKLLGYLLQHIIADDPWI